MTRQELIKAEGGLADVDEMESARVDVAADMREGVLDGSLFGGVRGTAKVALSGALMLGFSEENVSPVVSPSLPSTSLAFCSAEAL